MSTLLTYDGWRSRVPPPLSDGCQPERVVTLAALAATAAGPSIRRRIHARKRQLQGHTELTAQSHDIFLVHRSQRRRDGERLPETKRHGARHRREKFRRRIRKRVAGERSER